MYIIRADDYVVHNGFMQDPDFAVISGTFREEFNRAGTLSFTIPPNNDAYKKGVLRKLITTIQVYDRRNKLIWKGRIIDTSKDFYNNITFNCEGWMGILNDSIIRPNGSGGGGSGGSTVNVVQRAVDWALTIQGDASHGYDQGSRWGPNYDCSSLVISAWEAAGVPVKTNGAVYTGNMYQVFTSLGFVDVTSGWSPENAVSGDVVLNHERHTAMISRWVNGVLYVVEAVGNEIGGATGGQSGDQTGREILERTWSDGIFSHMAWNAILRYPANQSSGGSSAGVIGTVPTYNLTDTQIQGLANVFVSEEGNQEAAVKAAASHLLNRFERYPINGLTDPYNYLIYAGWWGSASMNQARINGSYGVADANAVSWTAQVIRQGLRNIPLYIDEYDQLADIASATNNGVPITTTDRSQYIKDVTVIRNIYAGAGDTYTFYGFPGGADAFGYIAKRPGDVDFIPAEMGSGNSWSGSSDSDDIIIDPASYFVWLIQNHNEQVGGCKALNVVMPPNVFTTPVAFPAANYESTLDYIETNFLNNEEVGGRMWVEDTTIYYYPDGMEEVSTQPIVFGTNLLDLTEAYDASEVFTAIIPTGGEDENGNICKLGNPDYIVHTEGAAKYGIIVRHVEFPDILDPNVLAMKAIECLNKNIESTMSMEISAFDMGLVDSTAGDMKVGTFVEVRSTPHNLEKAYICTAMEIDLTNAANSKYTLGVNSDTLTTRQMKLSRNITNLISQTAENPSYDVTYTNIFPNNVEVQFVLFKRTGHSVQLQFRVKIGINIAANYGFVRLFTFDPRFIPNENKDFDTGTNETRKKSITVRVTTFYVIGINVTDAVVANDIITGSANWTYDE